MTMEEHLLHPSENTTTNARKKPGKEARLPFPVKVYEMLEDADSKGFAHIVSWNSQGNGFMVHKKELFIHQIVPQYFNQTRYKSFQRQLSLYGFQRVAVGNNKGLRHHENLRRGRYDLVCQMKPVGYKPRGTTKMMLEHQQNQQHDSIEPSAVTSDSSTPMLVYRQETTSSPMTALGANSEGIPTVISSGSVDKLCALTPRQFKALQQRHQRLVSPGTISEGEESSSEDILDEELQDIIERGLFEGMGFYLMMPNQPILQEFLPAPSLPLNHVAKAPLPAPGVMDAELKKAWQTGYNMALSMNNNSKTPPNSKQQVQQSSSIDVMPSSPRLLLEDCVDALDFHAANIAATTGANL